MPLATPNPSGEWQAATSVQANRIFGAGPAMAGEKICPPRTPAEPATPTGPAALRSARRDGGTRPDVFLVIGKILLGDTGNCYLRSLVSYAALRDREPAGAPAAASSACDKSSIISSGCSTPTDSRT